MQPLKPTKPFLFGIIIWLCTGLAPLLHAVVFYSTSDPNYNTTAPTGTLANSGWQWVGYWGSFQGTPIDAHHFLAANHVGGNVGDTFVFQGGNYTTVRSFVDTSTPSDLRIWEVREAFPTWAPLYRSTNEYNRSLIVIGRGITRGAEVRTTVAVSGVPANSLAGWQWGSYDGVLRWGTNTVAGFFTHATFGPQLAATFDQTGGANECDLGVYDSSAPVFINDGSAWKLAGVAGLVDGGFSTTSGGSTFTAFIYDERGLYVNGTLKTGGSAVPCAFYATRVSSCLTWVDSVLATPLSAEVTLGNLSQTYDGNSHPVTVTTSPSGLSVSVTYNGTIAAPVNAGSYTVLATVTSSGYTGSASGTLTVLKATQSITFGALSPVTIGDAAFTLSATASSGLPVSFTSSNNAVATISGSTVTLVGPGSATITADQAGDTNHESAPSVSQMLIVNAVQANPDSNGSDVPLGSRLVIALMALLFFVTGSLQLRRSTRQAS